VDNSIIFESVFATLASGECFGIFPEGISHEKSMFLFHPSCLPAFLPPSLSMHSPIRVLMSVNGCL
jgi:hypothetical protein